MRLRDKVALITGGGTGIGRAVAFLFAKEGAKVAVVGRRNGPLKETVSVIESGGGRAMLVEGDVSVARDVAGVMDKTIEKFGRMDVLINNAGVNYKSGGCVETDEDGWDVTMDINVKSIYLTSKFAAAELERTGGSIINIGSTRGIAGFPKAIAYCASKGAVVDLTRSMALDLAERGIRVNCVCPGPVDTPMTRESLEECGDYETVVKRILVDYPIRRIGWPEDIAHACLYFASNEAGWVTGAVLPLDGGFLVK